MNLKYYIFVKDNKLAGAGNCLQTTEGVSNIEVTQELFDDYCSDPRKYAYSDGQIIPNPDYEAEKEAERKAARRAELLEQLDALDLKAIRALRAIQSGTGTEADKDRLAGLEEQAAAVRAELQEL